MGKWVYKLLILKKTHHKMSFGNFVGQTTIGPFALDEFGVSIEIKTKSGEYSYNLEQLKKLKAELEDPLMQSLKEVS